MKFALLATMTLVSIAPCARGQAVVATPKLDLPAFTGTWYEIARFPNKWEKRCVGDAVMLVALGDKAEHFQLVRACKTKVGYMDSVDIDGKAQDKSGDGKLKLRTVWPFYKKFWVLGVGPEDSWSLIGSPNHKELWIYSKTKTMSPELFAELKGRAVSEGFSAEKLTMTPQNLQ